MRDTDEELVKIHIDLTGNADSGGEAMWAKALGGDLYEVRNVPFHAYGLNCFDVVRAVELYPDRIAPHQLTIRGRHRNPPASRPRRALFGRA